MGHATALFLATGPREGPKGQISLNFNFKVNYKEFKPNFLCLLKNGRYKTYQTGFSFGCLGHAPGVGLEVQRGVGGSFFSEIQPDLVCEFLT